MDGARPSRPEAVQRFLSEASIALASTLDYETTLEQIVRLALPTLADYCIVDLVQEDGRLRTVVAVHADPAKEALVRELRNRYPTDVRALDPAQQVLRSGQPAIYPEITQAMLAAGAVDAEDLEQLRALGPKSYMCVPLVARGQVLGCISFVSADESRRYSPADLEVSQDFAERCALAVDNARLYQQARDTEARYRDLFEKTAEAILVADADGCYVDANHAATELLGYAREELLGMRVADVAVADPQWTLDSWSRYIDEGRWRGELEVRRKDGSLVPVEAWATTASSPSGPIYISALRDVSERRALERAQQEFLAMVTHDLRNPLTTIAGYAQMLRRNEAYDERVVDALLSQTAHLDRLIGDLLDVSRLETEQLELRREELDLAELARAAAEQARAASERHTVSVQAPPTPLVGWWDPDRLAQAVQNLLSNAIKYSPGGEIILRLEDCGAEARLSVSDEGPGIPPEALPRLFDRFYRVESTAAGNDGLGLGLYITRMLVEAHGGRIEAESEPGQGATFSLTLPYQLPDDSTGQEER